MKMIPTTFKVVGFIIRNERSFDFTIILLDLYRILWYNNNREKKGENQMKHGIYFDLDGTVANLYGVEGWLADLEAENVRPYVVAKPMVNLSLLARYIHKAQRMGYTVGVISWLSKCGSPSYDEAVTTAKREWLAKHLPSVEWDEIHIVKYGTPKSTCRTYSGILFDDEQRNLDEWGEGAVIACDMLEVLRNLSM